MSRLRSPLRGSLREDGSPASFLGSRASPTGLAGLLAGRPRPWRYGYLVGTFTGGMVTSSSFMAVQATGAMAIVIADVDTISDADDPARRRSPVSPWRPTIVAVLVLLAAAVRVQRGDGGLRERCG